MDLEPDPDRERRFEDLPAWQSAMEFTMAVYRATDLPSVPEGSDAWPGEERANLRDDLRGAALAVPSKLANGWGGFDPEEPSSADHLLAQFEIARRSLRDAETLLHVANGSALVADDALERLLALGDETRSRLDALLRSLPEPEVEIDPVHPPFAAN